MSSPATRDVGYELRIGNDVEAKAEGLFKLSPEATVEELRQKVFDDSQDVLSLKNATPLKVYGPFELVSPDISLGHRLRLIQKVSKLCQGKENPSFVLAAPEPHPQGRPKYQQVLQLLFFFTCRFVTKSTASLTYSNISSLHSSCR